jgi:hypothetical protein
MPGGKLISSLGFLWVDLLTRIRFFFLYQLDKHYDLPSRKYDLKGNPRYRYVVVYGGTWIREVSEACLEVGLKPFISYGTLLGYCRDRNFYVDSEHDLDLGLLADDAFGEETASSLERAVERRGYKISRSGTFVDKNMGWVIRKRGHTLELDIHLFYREGDRVLDREEIYNCKWCTSFSAGIFEELQEIRFLEKVKVWVPGKPELFLEEHYGNWKEPEPDFSHYSISDSQNMTVEDKKAP